MEAKTLFHRNDPETSQIAAEKMVESGALSRQEEEVWGAIIDCVRFARRNHFTAKELTQSFYFDTHINAYHTIQRRLSGLCNKGKIKRIKIGEKRIGATDLFKPIYKKRDGCCVWRLV